MPPVTFLSVRFGSFLDAELATDGSNLTSLRRCLTKGTSLRSDLLASEFGLLTLGQSTTIDYN